MTTPTVRRAAPIDIVGVIDTLQQAFFDDPVISYLFPDEHSRRWRSAKMFETLLRGHHMPLNSVWTTAEHEGAALWAPPGHWILPPRELVRNAVPMTRSFGLHLPRALRVLSTMDGHHPRQPHWYLAVLGTAPRSQGHGVGSALMGPVLDRCDSEGLPAYLESSKESNIAFYSRFGFALREELRLPGGPMVWPMWRDPR
jgi:GNAT superfamily N-acetyltransferase